MCCMESLKVYSSILMSSYKVVQTHVIDLNKNKRAQRALERSPETKGF